MFGDQRMFTLLRAEYHSTSQPPPTHPVIQPPSHPDIAFAHFLFMALTTFLASLSLSLSAPHSSALASSCS